MTSNGGWHRFAWARLNADTLFLALLATGSAAFDFMDPMGDTVSAVVGFVGPLFYAKVTAYLAAGVLLTVALARGSTYLEVVARSILIGGITLNVYRHVIFVGNEVPTYGNIVLLVIVLLTTYLRLSVLVGKQGFAVSRPPATEGTI
jgi:hypothetical protein